ncbi:hypothetical protein ACJJTC_016196 [Scirpophaga incertulas]
MAPLPCDHGEQADVIIEQLPYRVIPTRDTRVDKADRGLVQVTSRADLMGRLVQNALCKLNCEKKLALPDNPVTRPALPALAEEACPGNGGARVRDASKSVMSMFMRLIQRYNNM